MTWLPGFARVPIGSSWPTHQAPVTKLVLHSTEGSSIAGAEAAYRARGVPPHVTYDPVSRVGHQHGPLDRASSSLWHVDRSGVIQVELVGFAVEAPSWPDEALRVIAADLVVPILRACPGIPLETPVVWLPYPASYGRSSARLTFAEWEAVAGIVGHSHAPARPRPWPLSKTNAHGDPGALNVARIIAHARQDLPAPTPDPPTPETPDMPEHLIICPTEDSAVIARYKSGHLSHLGGAEYVRLQGRVPELVETDPAAAARLVAEARALRTP